MTDKIEPALTPGEWAAAEVYREQHIGSFNTIRVERGEVHVTEWGGDDYQTDYAGSVTIMPKTIPSFIALANAALPDSDPRKITRKMLETLRGEDGGWVSVEYTRKIADALESYLPPEP